MMQHPLVLGIIKVAFLRPVQSLHLVDEASLAHNRSDQLDRERFVVIIRREDLVHPNQNSNI